MVTAQINAAGATLDPVNGVDLAEYAQSLLRRFSNPNIAHETYQIAMDGSKKMPQRIFEPALVALERGNDIDPFAFAAACWIRYLSGAHDNGERYDLRDPGENELSRVYNDGGQDTKSIVSGIFALPDLVPPRLAQTSYFHDVVVKHLHVMRSESMSTAIAKALNNND